MKHCLHLSVQLIRQDCFKCFGAGLSAHPVFSRVLIYLHFQKSKPVHGMNQVMPDFLIKL